MLFDFNTFQKVVDRAYPDDSPYTKDSVLFVFWEYFQAYEDFRGGRAHPFIKVSQIKRIINIMPFFEDEHEHFVDLEPEDYRAMIAQHFITKYNVGNGGCDYNINHFFSGDVRKNRFYEACY